MGITSFSFLLFALALWAVYMALPGRMQWGVLAAAGVFFYCVTDRPYLLLFPVFSTCLSFVASRMIGRLSDDASPEARGRQSGILAFYLFLQFGILFALKYLKLINPATGLWPAGLSFYTFILAGYVIDVFNGLVKPADSIARLFLNGTFFPVMVSGPIMRIREDGAQFFTTRRADYTNLTFGAQRMLWGFFQKLVVSERFALVVNTVYENPDTYHGMYIILAAVCFSFQLYTDFSGCMDIVLGFAETLGIRLPENFRAPFLSKSISEFWRRWHITLGAWMRDYVFYPLLRSRPFTALSALLTARFGKKRGRRLVNYAAMFLLWLAVGLWHGGELKFVIGVGLLHWFYIVAGETAAVLFFKKTPGAQAKEGARLADALRVLRTFLLVTIGLVFFRAASTAQALAFLKNSVSVWNPQILWNGGIFSLGMDWIEWGVLAVSMVILVTVNLYRYGITGSGGTAYGGERTEAEKEDAREETHRVRHRLCALPLAIRWALWMAFLFYVILLGRYGPGFRAADFIYRGF